MWTTIALFTCCQNSWFRIHAFFAVVSQLTLSRFCRQLILLRHTAPWIGLHDFEMDNKQNELQRLLNVWSLRSGNSIELRSHLVYIIHSMWSTTPHHTQLGKIRVRARVFSILCLAGLQTARIVLEEFMLVWKPSALTEYTIFKMVSIEIYTQADFEGIIILCKVYPSQGSFYVYCVSVFLSFSARIHQIQISSLIRPCLYKQYICGHLVRLK